MNHIVKNVGFSKELSTDRDKKIKVKGYSVYWQKLYYFLTFPLLTKLNKTSQDLSYGVSIICLLYFWEYVCWNRAVFVRMEKWRNICENINTDVPSLYSKFHVSLIKITCFFFRFSYFFHEKNATKTLISWHALMEAAEIFMTENRISSNFLLR